MGLRIEKVAFNLFSSEQSLRFDYGFINYKNNQLNISEYYTFSDIFNFVDKEDIDLSQYSEIKYVEIGDISKQGDINPIKINLDNRDEFLESLYKKIDKGDIISVKKGDILISSIRPNLKKIALIQDDSENYFYTKALIHLRPKIDSTIAYYLLRTISFEYINCVSRIGKGYPTLKVEDLKTITFNKNEIDSILDNVDIEYINNILLEINLFIQSQEQESDIINEVLSEELCFNIAEFNSFNKKGIYQTNVFDFSENIDLRFSAKFHNPSHSYMHDFLNKKTNKRVKDFVSEPIVLGKSVSPSDYDENGECHYMSMATIKSWYFDDTEAKSVSSEYERANTDKKVSLNDIIIARSGEGTIGKVALIDNEDVNAVFADFTMRVRLQNYNHQFAYYYFRSLFFQHLVEHNKKGLGNNTNIFPSQIQEFPMLDFPLDKQQEIVEKIKHRIEEQQAFTFQIEAKRNEIEKIILDTLTF